MHVYTFETSFLYLNTTIKICTHRLAQPLNRPKWMNRIESLYGWRVWAESWLRSFLYAKKNGTKNTPRNTFLCAHKTTDIDDLSWRWDYWVWRKMKFRFKIKIILVFRQRRQKRERKCHKYCGYNVSIFRSSQATHKNHLHNHQWAKGWACHGPHSINY